MAMSSIILALIRPGEERDTRRIAVKKVFPADRPDFALCKKPGDWNRSHAFLHHHAVMVGMAEEPFAAAAAAKQERPQRRMPMLGAIRCEKHVQVIAGRFGVPKLKLNRLAFLHEIPDRDGSRLLVGAHEVAHQKISALKPAAVFIDGDADVQYAMSIPAAAALQ